MECQCQCLDANGKQSNHAKQIVIAATKMEKLKAIVAMTHRWLTVNQDFKSRWHKYSIAPFGMLSNETMAYQW